MRDDIEHGDRGGLRIEPRSGVKRLTFVGDSVTAGQGVPDVGDRFVNRVRAALGPGVEVQVFAQGGLERASVLHAALRGSYALDFLWWRLHLLSNPAVRRYRDVVRDAYQGDTWTAQQQQLLAIRDSVRAAGARFAVVTLPLFDAADQPWQHEIYARIDRFWREADVPHLDLGPQFAGRDPATLVASPWDEHPNAAIHGEIADAMLRFLRDELGF